MNSRVDFNQFYDENTGRRLYSRSPCLFTADRSERIRANSESSSSLTKELAQFEKIV